MALGHATMEGWAYKQGGFWKSWKRHWFSLRGTILHYSRRQNGHEKGRIDLTRARLVTTAPECPRQPALLICIPCVRTYYICPPTPDDAHEWISTLDSVRRGRPATVPKPSRGVGINNFNFIATIGRGTYGVVQLVRHTGNGQLYAMKVMSKQMLADYAQIDQTLRERRVLLQTVHPFLVGAHYAFQTDTKVFLVLDYVPGGELFARLRQEIRFSEARTQLYAAEILLGLGHLHSLGFVYRDLKPENILVDEDGHIKLTDFGLVKGNLCNEKATTSTFCGTPGYIAPEVLLRKPYTRSVDWWSFGILVYEMLVGLPPFWNSNSEIMLRSVLSDQVRFPAGISGEARDLIQKLLVRDGHTRLGAGQEDFEEIKQHRFFAGLCWSAVIAKQMETEWRPDLKNPTDTSHFDPEFVQGIPAGAAEEAVVVSPQTQRAFLGFSYVNESRL
jgi:serine/threonine protein kinase